MLGLQAMPGIHCQIANPDQIKQILAQKQELATKAAMSSIDLTLQQKPNAAGSSAANASWANDTWNSAMSSAYGAVRVTGAAAIWLIAYSPFWGVPAFGAVWFYRSRRRAIGRAQVA